MSIPLGEEQVCSHVSIVEGLTSHMYEMVLGMVRTGSAVSVLWSLLARKHTRNKRAIDTPLTQRSPTRFTHVCHPPRGAAAPRPILVPSLPSHTRRTPHHTAMRGHMHIWPQEQRMDRVHRQHRAMAIMRGGKRREHALTEGA